MSPTQRRRSCAALVFSSVVCVSSWAAADPTAEQREAAREHFRLGNEAFARGEHEAALGEYQRAYVLARSFDIACNLGRVEYELGSWADAAHHLGECLENFSASTRAELRNADARLSELFGEVRAKVALLRIDVEPERASVSVGSRSVLGPWPAKVYVLPGEHVIVASLEGREPASRALRVVAGSEENVHFALEPKANAPAAVPAESQAALRVAPPSDALGEGDALASLKVPVLIGGGVLTVLGVGFGAYFLARRGELADDAERQRSELQGGRPGAGACNDPSNANEGACASLQGTLEDGRQAERFSVGGFVAGGAFALGTAAAYFLWPEERQSVSLRLEPRVGVADERGLWGAFTGRF